MELGEKIYIESLLSDIEYREMACTYPHTYQKMKKPSFFRGDFMWRYRMGQGLTPEEIATNNEAWAVKLKKAGL